MNFTHINIYDLINNNGISRPNNYGKFDLETLARKKISKEKIIKPIDIDVNTLLDVKKKRQELLQEAYNNILEQCWDKIKIANQNGITDFVFDVPFYIQNILEYNSNKCIEFIKKTLEDNYIHVYILKKNTLWITWHDLETNINKSKNHIHNNNNKNTH